MFFDRCTPKIYISSNKERLLVYGGRIYLCFDMVVVRLFVTYDLVVSTEAGDFASCCPVPDKDGLVESCRDKVALVDSQSTDALLMPR